MSARANATTARQQHRPSAGFSLAALDGWVCVKPAISVFCAGDGLELAGLLSRRGFRVVAVEPAHTAPRTSSGRPCGLPLRERLIPAVFDSALTVIDLADGNAPAVPLRALARSLGLAMALKNQYHVALVLGGLPGLGLSEFAHEIETASGLTLGPDFGVCQDVSAAMCHPPMDQDVPVLQVCDRRAAANMSTLYAAGGLTPRFDGWPGAQQA